MEDNAPIQTQKSGSGFWIGFWLTLLLVAAVGGAGAYLDFRLEQFEKQIVQQQVEIKQNREDAKVFTQNLTSTLDSLSTMMNQTVTSFTEQTTKLASVIETKEKSQSKYLQTAIEELNVRIQKENEELRTSLATLSKEITDNNAALRTVQAKAESADQRAEKANQQIAALQDSVKDDFSNLTQLAKAMSESVQAQFDTQAANFSRELDMLNESTQGGMQKLSAQVQTIDVAQRESAEQVAELTENLSGVKTQQKQIAQTISDNAQCVSGSVGSLQENLKAMAGQLELGFASAVEQNDVLRSDLAEIGYTLTERTEDLLVQMIDAQKAVTSDGASAEGIRASLNNYAKDVTKFMNSFAKEISTLNQSVQVLTDRVVQENGSSVATTVTEVIEEPASSADSEKTVDESKEPKTIGLNTLEFPQH